MKGSKAIDMLEHHMIIRETIGYELISKLEEYDIPEIMDFLKICHNYIKMKRLQNEE